MALAAQFVILKAVRKHYTTWKNLVEWRNGLPDDLPGKQKANSRCEGYARTVWEHIDTLSGLSLTKDERTFFVDELSPIAREVGLSLDLRTSDHDRLMDQLGGKSQH